MLQHQCCCYAHAKIYKNLIIHSPLVQDNHIEDCLKQYETEFSFIRVNMMFFVFKVTFNKQFKTPAQIENQTLGYGLCVYGL